MSAPAASIDVMVDEAAMEELLAPIRERNREKLLLRLGRVRAAIAGGRETRATPTDELRADLHALVGALGTYGWAAGSDLLRNIQAAVAEGRPAAEHVPALDALVREVAG
jgi:hypothetical protein